MAADRAVRRAPGPPGVPGQPDRPVALRRREVPELLTEELRRLDPDDVYAATVRRMHKMHKGDGSAKTTSTTKTTKATKAA